MLRRLFGSSKKKQPPAEPLPEERAADTKPPEAREKPWIGVDLDGTLAKAVAWQGMTHIGPPVPPMVRRVQFWTQRGLTVKILTARGCSEEGIAAVKRWLVENGMPELEVTDKKDFSMVELWDDRAIQIVRNTGRPFLSPSIYGRPKAPILPEEASDSTFYLLKPGKPEDGR